MKKLFLKLAVIVLFTSSCGSSPKVEFARQTFYAKKSTVSDSGGKLHAQWQANIDAACKISNGANCYVLDSQVVEKHDLDSQCDDKSIVIEEIIVNGIVNCDQ